MNLPVYARFRAASGRWGLSQSLPLVATIVVLVATNPSQFLNACMAQPTDHVPVWFMRQAGRSLPEYRAKRGSGSILDAIKQPELSAELTLQPVQRYGVDAAILYSDIMVPMHAIGFGVDIEPGVGPVVGTPFSSESDLSRIGPFNAEEHTPYVIETIKILMKELEIPLIGFAGAPFTVASYLIEGKPTREWLKTKAMMHEQPSLWHSLMNRIADTAIASLRAQVLAGASAIQLFDSWAGALNPDEYAEFVLPNVTRVFDDLADLKVPRILFGVGTSRLLPLMAKSGADVVGVDHHIKLNDAIEQVDGHAVQGNLDPEICLQDWATIEPAATSILNDGMSAPGHIFNLGHGVLPQTDPSVLQRLVELVHEFK